MPQFADQNPPRAELPLRMPSIDQLTEDEVIQLLESFVAHSITNSFKAISDMYIKDIKMADVYTYSLTTCTETRSTKWMFVPYKAGDTIDSATESRPTVDPWLIQVTPQPGSKKVSSQPLIVPHSDRVTMCHTCGGTGKVTCRSCGGSGRTSSTSTDSEGRRRTTYSTCLWCGGSGKRTCGSCNGQCYLKVFLTMKVHWNTRSSVRVVDTSGSGLKESCFLKCNSTTVLMENMDNLPFTAEVFDDSNKYQEQLVHTINEVIKSHQLPSTSIGKIVAQKQVVKHLPIAIIGYRYKGKVGNFFIVGNERRVKFDDYPTKMCVII